MPIEFIPARVGSARAPAVDQLIDQIREQSEALGIADGVMYYGWPKFTDYEAVRHYVDLAILARSIGALLIRVIATASSKQVIEAAESISQASATAISQLVRSPLLRTRDRQLKVKVTPALFVPGYEGLQFADVDVFGSQPALIRFIRDQRAEPLTDSEFKETRSILEGAKALVRPVRRTLDDPRHQRLGQALSQLEEEIAVFDQRQRHVALTALGCPERAPQSKTGRSSEPD
jgi:superfamily I DNA and RNA helicase